MSNFLVDYYIVEVCLGDPVMFVINSSEMTQEEADIIEYWCNPTRKRTELFGALKTQPGVVTRTLSRFWCIQSEMGCEDHPHPFRELRCGEILDGRVRIFDMFA